MKTSKGLFLLVAMLLVPLLVSAANPECPAYDRKAWKHWVDEDRDCQNARHEVLITESTSPVVFKTEKGCRVVSGSWDDPYSGKTITYAWRFSFFHL